VRKMGKKRKSKNANRGPPEIPVFYVKRQKLHMETSLTALVALHKYCGKFKLGPPGFREKSRSPYTITAVMNGAELGTGQHGDREQALEKAALVTLHLLDPEGKSIVANIAHHNEGELKALCQHIINAKQDDIKGSSLGGVGLANIHKPPLLGPLFPPVNNPFAFAQPGNYFPPPLPPPPPQVPKLGFPYGGGGGGGPSSASGAALVAFGGGPQNTYSAAPAAPPPPMAAAPIPAAPAKDSSAALPPLSLAPPPNEPRLLWTDDNLSPEEARAATYASDPPLPRETTTQDDDDDDDDFVERALAEHEASEAALALQSRRTITDLL